MDKRHGRPWLRMKGRLATPATNHGSGGFARISYGKSCGMIMIEVMDLKCEHFVAVQDTELLARIKYLELSSSLSSVLFQGDDLV